MKVKNKGGQGAREIKALPPHEWYNYIPSRVVPTPLSTSTITLSTITLTAGRAVVQIGRGVAGYPHPLAGV